jgi:hypothetical protein
MSDNFVENERMQIEARYENEDGSITVKYLEVSEDAADYFQKMHYYIGWLQDELLRQEAEPMVIEFSANSPLILN